MPMTLTAPRYGSLVVAPADAEAQAVAEAEAVATAEDSPRLRVEAWPDPVIDALGHDPRSWYVEYFWLPVLGPTSTWLLRRLVAALDASPGGVVLDVEDTARSLGLGGRAGRHSPFQRSVSRCVTFELARIRGAGALAVRRRVPPLPRRHLMRLPLSLQDQHRHWADVQLHTPVVEHMRRRAGRLALGLLELGEDPPAVELELVRLRIHPAIAHEATRWACAFRRRASESPTATATAIAGAVDRDPRDHHGDVVAMAPGGQRPSS